MIRCHGPEQLGRKRFISPSQSIIKRSQSRNLETDIETRPWRKTVPPGFSDCFLIAQVAPLRVSQALASHPSRKWTTDLPTGQASWGIFFNWGSLFQNDDSLCQVDKLASQGCFKKWKKKTPLLWFPFTMWKVPRIFKKSSRECYDGLSISLWAAGFLRRHGFLLVCEAACCGQHHEFPAPAGLLLVLHGPAA